MVLITTSTTVPVNPLSTNPVLSREDLWTALVLKARDPKQFVPVIEKSEIISEGESGLTRRVLFKGDEGSKSKDGDGVEERVVFVGGMKIDFIIPTTGQCVSNIISTSPDGELYLTFTFQWPHPELEAGTVEVRELERERGELSRGVVPRTVEVARGLKRDGLLHLE